MDFIIEKLDFLRVLQRIQGIVDKKSTMPILSNVLVEAADGKVNIAATDLEIFIKDACPATVKKEGSVTVNARKLFEIVKELPESTVAISNGEGERVSIKSGKARFNIMGLPVKEFPSFPPVEDDKLTKVEPDILGEMIDKTAFAVSTDETRYNINGFFLEKDKDILRMVTTDGHRLAMIEKEAANVPGEKKGVILPKKGVTELRKLMEEKEGDFFFGITDKSVTMKKGDTLINVRLIEGDFPDYKQVIPKENDKLVMAERAVLLGSLKRVSILSSDKVKGVKFGLKKGKLTLSSSSPELGDATEEIDVEYDGDELDIAFNARYFLDALEAVGEEKVGIELKDQMSPGILRPKETAGSTYIIMPMRL
ncbi:MAG: DNA polymerase III subunit beta [Thermodesulfobacteriota bacterium]